jgi:cytochrome c oxidase subunit 3
MSAMTVMPAVAEARSRRADLSAEARSAKVDLSAEARSAKADAARLGLQIFLATVTMLFAAFTSAYLVRRGGADWVAIPLPRVLWRNTAVLIASSLALEAAWHTGSRGRTAWTKAAFAMSLLFGAWFVQGQLQAWTALTSIGVFLPSSPHASFVYMLTGAHAVHVIAALGVLVWGALETWRGEFATEGRHWARVMSTCRTFWHFLLGVWVYVFALLATG